MGQYFHPVIFEYEDGHLKILAWISTGGGLKLMEHCSGADEEVMMLESLLIPGGLYHNSRVVWAGDYADEEATGSNLYYISKSACRDVKPKCHFHYKEYLYIANHSKHQYVNKTVSVDQGIHPLIILTAEGNGRGWGGDYDGPDKEMAGVWARDIISVEKEPPADYTELKVGFNNEW